MQHKKLDPVIDGAQEKVLFCYSFFFDALWGCFLIHSPIYLPDLVDKLDSFDYSCNTLSAANTCGY